MAAKRSASTAAASSAAEAAGTDLNGAAVLDACRQLRERLAPVAAELGDVPFATLIDAAFLIGVGLAMLFAFANPLLARVAGG